MTYMLQLYHVRFDVGVVSGMSSDTPLVIISFHDFVA
jgi:hypothetical protein